MTIVKNRVKEASSGIGIKQTYGQGYVGGEGGKYNSKMPTQEYAIDVIDGFTSADGQLWPNKNAVVVGVDTTFLYGTVNTLTIGGKDISTATLASPVVLSLLLDTAEDWELKADVTGSGELRILYQTVAIGALSTSP